MNDHFELDSWYFLACLQVDMNSEPVFKVVVLDLQMIKNVSQRLKLHMFVPKLKTGSGRKFHVLMCLTLSF